MKKKRNTKTNKNTVLRQGKSHKRIWNAECDAFLQGPNTSVTSIGRKTLVVLKLKKNLKTVNINTKTKRDFCINICSNGGYYLEGA